MPPVNMAADSEPASGGVPFDLPLLTFFIPTRYATSGLRGPGRCVWHERCTVGGARKPLGWG